MVKFPAIIVSRWAIKSIVIGVTLFVTFIVTSVAAQADIYLYVDRQGVMHFTNTPTSAKYKVYMSDKAKYRKALYNIKSYDDVISEAATRNGISSSLLKAVIHVESYFNPKAVSKKGALGLMQIMPENLDALNISDPFDPWENIMGGAYYFKTMLERFSGQVDLALAAYNAGPTAVEKYNDIPPYPETQRYVRKVMRAFRIYRKS
jgi:soluble lytic murein transglycosylase-like protein